MEARHLLAVVLLMLVSLDAVALAVDNVDNEEDFYTCLPGIKPYIGGELMYCCSVRCDCGGEDDCCK